MRLTPTRKPSSESALQAHCVSEEDATGMSTRSDQRHRLPDEWIAIVDDDGSVRTALARVLRAEGLRVDTFCTSQDYLAARSPSSEPSCLVLDIHLGGASSMSGFELHDFLAERGPMVPIILMTAHDEVPSADLARRVGCDGYLRKPFECDAFVNLVRRTIRTTAAD